MPQVRTRRQKDHAAQLRLKQLSYSLSDTQKQPIGTSYQSGSRSSSTGQTAPSLSQSLTRAAHKMAVSDKSQEMASLFGYDTKLIYKDLLRTLVVAAVVLSLLAVIYWRVQ